MRTRAGRPQVVVHDPQRWPTLLGSWCRKHTHSQYFKWWSFTIPNAGRRSWEAGAGSTRIHSISNGGSRAPTLAAAPGKLVPKTASPIRTRIHSFSKKRSLSGHLRVLVHEIHVNLSVLIGDLLEFAGRRDVQIRVIAL